MTAKYELEADGIARAMGVEGEEIREMPTARTSKPSRRELETDEIAREMGTEAEEIKEMPATQTPELSGGEVERI